MCLPSGVIAVTLAPPSSGRITPPIRTVVSAVPTSSGPSTPATRWMVSPSGT